MTREIVGTVETGSLYATRVRIRTTQGSLFDGRTGQVVRVHHSGAIEVRLGAGIFHDRRLCFGRSELEVLR